MPMRLMPPLTRYPIKGTVAVNPASIAAGDVSPLTFTLAGARVGDALTLNPPAAGLTAGLLAYQSFVSDADEITVVFQNTTGGAIDEPEADWTYALVRGEAAADTTPGGAADVLLAEDGTALLAEDGTHILSEDGD